MTGRTEQRSQYSVDPDATAQMAADERIHAEVVSGLAARSRARLSGSFRAAVFGMNDGLLSNLSLIIGVGASGVDRKVILLTGLAGLLAGALSMGVGEYISVTSQREMLEASTPDPAVYEAVADLDVDANELALVYRARGMGEGEAAELASKVLDKRLAFEDSLENQDFEELGTGMKAATSSFVFFVWGAVFPILRYLVVMSGWWALISAMVLVGAVLFFVGGAIGIISGSSPFRRGLRQLALGCGAALITYMLGWAFGASGL
jgi:VIT1/CCC1 family predicted Fe2+/Mn2+ transporter